MYLEAEALRAEGKASEAGRIMAEFSQKSALANLTRDITERIKQDPKDPKLRLKLARLYLKGSDFDRAANQYQICLQLDKSQPDARRELAGLVATHPNAGAAFGTPAAAALKQLAP
jgi:thioredoxin-like negative regulator of GroEL